MTDYLKIPEVARRLDVSEPTVRRMVKSGKLPSVFVGGAYRVSEEDLANYLEAAKVEPGDGSPKGLEPPLPFEEVKQRREISKWYSHLKTLTDKEIETHRDELEAELSALSGSKPQTPADYRAWELLAERHFFCMAELQVRRSKIPDADRRGLDSLVG